MTHQENVNPGKPNAGRSHTGHGPGADRARGSRKPRDPFAQLANEFPGLLAHAVSTFAPTDGPGISVFDFNPGAFTPLSETSHEGDDFVVKLELPGVDAENVNVELDNSRLIVSGEKREAVSDAHKKLREIRYGVFKRVYPVPARVDADNIEANFSNGVLTVRVKDALKKSDGIKINVNNS